MSAAASESAAGAGRATGAGGASGAAQSSGAVPVFGECGRLSLPGLVVHGGAGVFHGLDEKGRSTPHEEVIRAALEAGWAMLAAGGPVLDAVVEAVATFEDSGRFNAGRGAVPTVDGNVEFDASVMDGSSRRVGAVCAATWPANPVRVAREVAELGGPPGGPLLLAGAGADRFAEQHGFPPMDPAWLTGLRAASPAGAVGPAGAARPAGANDPAGAAGPAGANDPAGASGTVGAVAVDAGGHIAAATSTGGRSGQMSGRVGDSAIPGAGVWAAADTVAVSATGTGEAFMVTGFGRMIDLTLRHEVFRGEGVLDETTVDEETLAEALLEAAIEAALRDVAGLGGEGGGIAITPAGTYAAKFTSAAMARGWRDTAGVSTRIGR